MNLKTAEKKLRQAIGAGKTTSDGISRLKDRPILIYGAGNYGRIIYRLLIENGISKDSVLGFLDVAAGDDSKLFNLPVRRPDALGRSENHWTDAEIIISIYCSIEEQTIIQERLKNLGYKYIRTCYEIAVAFHNANDPSSRICTTGFLNANIDNIINGCSFWQDELSIQTYVNHFIGYADCDIDSFILEKNHKQYFAPPPLHKKGYSRFIDCGAFDGDTIRDLIDLAGKVESVIVFEPCNHNFEKLSKYILENECCIAERIELYPCGVWNKTEQLQFNDDAAAASAISKSGESFIQCVAIDEALHGFNPTFIKMDIEGAEPKALKGAEFTIRKSKPDLAISVYHSLSHFWEIPQLIHQWVPEYRFYLRTYGAAGFETIMYAVAKKDNAEVGK